MHLFCSSEVWEIMRKLSSSIDIYVLCVYHHKQTIWGVSWLHQWGLSKFQRLIRFEILFLLYINDLHKIINKTSAPVIFADVTSTLFAHSNLTDLNKNIHVVFTTLNKWLRANQLSLNFNKTNYVHFTTKRNMSINLKIGFNNNFIINNTYTKFLGVTMNNTLFWINHIDLLIKKN